jgi:isoquinoline 1-oxidoreductase beta subunit
LKGDGTVEAWKSVAGEHDPLAIDGALPPYAIPNLTVDHFPVELPLPTGLVARKCA